MRHDDEDENDRQRALSRCLRWEAGAAAAGRELGMLGFGPRSSSWCAPFAAPTAEQVRAEDLHADLLTARGAFLEQSDDAFALAMPGRASWSTTAALLALDRRAADLRLVQRHDHELLQLARSWTAERPRSEHGAFMTAMAAALAAFGGERVPRVHADPIAGLHRRDLARAAERDVVRREAEHAAAEARTALLLATLRAHGGLAAGALEKKMGVKSGSASALLAALLAAGQIANRGTPARPRYHIVDKV